MPARRIWFFGLGLGVLLALGLFASAGLAADAWLIRLNKDYLNGLLAGKVNQVTSGRQVAADTREVGVVSITTTLDPHLQRWATALVGRIKSKRVAVVIMEADTGKILALAGARRGRLDARVALQGGPAASLFKVVTAVATLEETHLTPQSRLAFVGRPHTLYRGQLKRRLPRRRRYVSLSQGFADSNNVVFARLGIYRVGAEPLTRYGRALGFNRRLAFELPLQMSRMPTINSTFELGEVSCGFHRFISITPVHAALMAATVVNGGLLMEPYIVASVKAVGGRELYRGRPHPVGFAMSFHTSLQMRRLFARTIKKGTARKAFRRLWRDRVLRRLDIGGKTGTLRTASRTELFEWFTGYGRDKASGRSVALCIMLAHGKTKWASPRKIARRALREVFARPPRRSGRVARQ